MHILPGRDLPDWIWRIQLVAVRAVWRWNVPDIHCRQLPHKLCSLHKGNIPDRQRDAEPDQLHSMPRRQLRRRQRSLRCLPTIQQRICRLHYLPMWRGLRRHHHTRRPYLRRMHPLRCKRCNIRHLRALHWVRQRLVRMQRRVLWQRIRVLPVQRMRSKRNTAQVLPIQYLHRRDRVQVQCRILWQWPWMHLLRSLQPQRNATGVSRWLCHRCLSLHMQH